MSRFRVVTVEPRIDFHEVTDYLFNEKGIDYRNMSPSNSRMDCWKWLLENDFSDFSQGGTNYLSFDSIDNYLTPEYVKDFLTVFKEAVEDHEAFDEENNWVRCEIDW